MTNGRGQGDKGRIAEEAARWVARLQSSDATDEDRRQFAECLERVEAGALEVKAVGTQYSVRRGDGCLPAGI